MAKPCNTCATPIQFVATANGKWRPSDPDGSPHKCQIRFLDGHNEQAASKPRQWAQTEANFVSLVALGAPSEDEVAACGCDPSLPYMTRRLR